MKRRSQNRPCRVPGWMLYEATKPGFSFLVHGQVTIIFVVSVCLSVCLFVQFFSAVFDQISIKLGHMLCVWV